MRNQYYFLSPKVHALEYPAVFLFGLCDLYRVVLQEEEDLYDSQSLFLQRSLDRTFLKISEKSQDMSVQFDEIRLESKYFSQG